jgi:hypothetical protein
VKHALAVPALAIGWFSSGLPGACGLAAIAFCVGHLSHPWAGLAAALVAATSPVFYVGCADRTGGPAFAALAVAVSGLAVGAWGSGPRGVRGGATALGMLGLGLGWRASGALLGAALPAASVALAGALTCRDGVGRVTTAIACAAGAAALTLAGLGLYRTSSADPRPLLEAAALSARHSAEFPVGEIGRALFPWSALLPPSLAALTDLPSPSPPTPAGDRERASALRVLMLTGAALSYGMSALPTSDPRRATIVSLVFAASAVGLWIGDIGRGARLSAPALVALALFVAVLGLDFLRLPATRLATFAPGPLAPASPAGVPPQAAFFVAMGLTLAGALVACWPSSDRRRGEWPPSSTGWRRTIGRVSARHALFVGALLGALVIRGSYDPASPAGSTHEAP